MKKILICVDVHGNIETWQRADGGWMRCKEFLKIYSLDGHDDFSERIMKTEWFKAGPIENGREILDLYCEAP